MARIVFILVYDTIKMNKVEQLMHNAFWNLSLLMSVNLSQLSASYLDPLRGLDNICSN